MWLPKNSGHNVVDSAPDMISRTVAISVLQFGWYFLTPHERMLACLWTALCVLWDSSAASFPWLLRSCRNVLKPCVSECPRPRPLLHEFVQCSTWNSLFFLSWKSTVADAIMNVYPEMDSFWTSRYVHVHEQNSKSKRNHLVVRVLLVYWISHARIHVAKRKINV